MSFIEEDKFAALIYVYENVLMHFEGKKKTTSAYKIASVEFHLLA